MSRRGGLLLEQVVAIGLLGFVLLMAAAMIAQTGRGGRQARMSYEATTIANNILETYQTHSVSLLPLGTLTPIQGQLSDGTPYTADLETYSLAGTPMAAGLTDDDLKGMRVELTWVDDGGSHQARCEGLLVRIPR